MVQEDTLQHAQGEVSEAVTRPPDDMAGDRAHVAGCPGCKKIVESMVAAEMNIHNAIRNIQQGAQQTGETPNCPSENELLDLAAGLLTDEQSATLTHHTSGCGHCGPLLREFMEDMAPADEKILAEIEAVATPAWSRELAHRLAAASPAAAAAPKRRGLPAWIYGVATTAVAAIVAGVIAWPAWQLRHAEQLTLEAYAEKRQIDFQLPGAQHANIDRKRGADAPSPALADAESKVAAHQDDPKWLAARGRVELLKLDYAKAIDDLEAAQKNGDSPNLQIDLAAGYFGRGQTNLSPADFQKSYDLLTRVIQADPTNSAAIFNRALAAHELKNDAQAAADWDRYLQLVPTGPWADEARRHSAEGH